MGVSLTSRRWDHGLFAAAAGLSLLGGLTMVSATASVNPHLAIRHAAWIAVGILLSLGSARIPMRRWMDLTGLAWAVSLAALVLVLLAGTMRLGATRWLTVFGVSVQPAEFTKLVTIGVLARYLAGQPSPLPGRALGVSLVLGGLPALLIFLQPDLGSASVLGAIWLGMVWTAGVSRRLLLGIAAGAMALAPVGWQLLKDYQRDRLLAFLDPHADPLGAGYTIIQSTIAIGSGGLRGRGWFAGTQNQLNFLPERHSDFIFSVIGEEWGFLGAVLVVGLCGALLARTLELARDIWAPHGRLFIAGVFSWLGYQTVVNLGMAMGLLPVVGVPLPLVSYGGSSMVTAWIALGLLQGIRRSERLA